METDKLRKFLLKANQAGYAGGEEKKWIKEKDESTTIPFEDGDFRLHDNFFGGEPYGGRSVVFYEDQPLWIMVYYGKVYEGVDNNKVYEILRHALMQMPESAPFRGPNKYKEDDYTYINSWSGNVEEFIGEEKIFFEEELIYKANYLGGLVDKQEVA